MKRLRLPELALQGVEVSSANRRRFDVSGGEAQATSNVSASGWVERLQVLFIQRVNSQSFTVPLLSPRARILLFCTPN